MDDDEALLQILQQRRNEFNTAKSDKNAAEDLAKKWEREAERLRKELDTALTATEAAKATAKKEMANSNTTFEMMVNEFQQERKIAEEDTKAAEKKAKDMGIVNEMFLNQIKATEDALKRETLAMKEKISDLEGREKALLQEVADKKQEANKKIEVTIEEIATLKKQNEALATEATSAKNEAKLAKSKIWFARLQKGLAVKRTHAAVEEKSASTRAALDAQDAATKAAESIVETAKSAHRDQVSAKHQAQIESIMKQLQIKDDDVNDLQTKLRQEEAAYLKLQQNSRAMTIDARTVSTDLMHSYLKNTRPEIEAIHLRDHEWVVSSIAFPTEDVVSVPAEQNHVLNSPSSPSSRQRGEPIAMVVDVVNPSRPTAQSHNSATNATKTSVIGAQNHTSLNRATDPHARAPQGSREPSRKDSATDTVMANTREQRVYNRRTRTPICFQCYKQYRDCVGGAHCRACREARERCTYLFCASGKDCRYPGCGKVHPGQEYADGEALDIVHGLKRRREN